MEKRQYIRHLFSLAFVKPWNIAERISGIASIIGGVIATRLGGGQVMIQILPWAIPLGVFVIIAIYRLSVARYLIKIEEKDREIKELKDRKYEVERLLQPHQYISDSCIRGQLIHLMDLLATWGKAHCLEQNN